MIDNKPPERLYLQWCGYPYDSTFSTEPVAFDDEEEGMENFEYVRADTVQAKPEMPEPDWDSAPEWAQWWAVDAKGDAIWFIEKPEVVYNAWYAEFEEYADEINLPFGIDWRLTLQQRPQPAAEAQPAGIGDNEGWP